MARHVIHASGVAAVIARARKITEDIAGDVKDDSRMLVPVDTGYLRSTAYVLRTSPDSWDIGYTADYAKYVEFGTRNMRAQPYLVPAAMKRR